MFLNKPNGLKIKLDLFTEPVDYVIKYVIVSFV